MAKKKIDLEEFSRLFKNLVEEHTYTARKYALRQELFDYLSKKCSGTDCEFSRDSPSFKVHSTQNFTIFRVRENQRGQLREFRGRWVLMYCYSRYGYSHDCFVNDLKKGVGSDKLVQRFAVEFANHFVPSEP